jgi:hypothetical protein
MVQSSEVLTPENNRISLISARRAMTQEDYLAITERELPLNMTEQTWIFGVWEEARPGRMILKFVDTLAKVARWLNHLGSGEIDDAGLEARHNIQHNFKINTIGR